MSDSGIVVVHIIYVFIVTQQSQCRHGVVMATLLVYLCVCVCARTCVLALVSCW